MRHNSEYCVIVDPLNILNNVGKTAFNYSLIKSLFQKICFNLFECCVCLNGTLRSFNFNSNTDPSCNLPETHDTRRNSLSLNNIDEQLTSSCILSKIFSIAKSSRYRC